MNPTDAIGEARCRQLTVATGGRYKGYLADKIVAHLKSNFLEAKKRKLTLDEVLADIREQGVSKSVKDRLVDDALVKHPRIKVIKSGEQVQFAYVPPLQISSKSGLLKLLKERQTKYESGEGDEVGVLQNAVLDSMPLADRAVEALLADGKIMRIPRLDNDQVLFYKKPEPDLDKCRVNSRFVDLWRGVDVANKEMEQIQAYLRNRNLPVTKPGDFNDGSFWTPESDKTFREEDEKAKEQGDGAKKGPKAKKKKAVAETEEGKPKRRSKRVIKDNVHVKADLMDVDLSD